MQTEVPAICPSKSIDAPKRFMVLDADFRCLAVFQPVTARVDALVLFRKALPGRTEKRLSGETLVAVVQSTDLRECDNLAFLRCRSLPWKRCLLVQGQVGAGSIVVREVGLENAPKVPLVPHDNMIQALTAD